MSWSTAVSCWRTIAKSPSRMPAQHHAVADDLAQRSKERPASPCRREGDPFTVVVLLRRAPAPRPRCCQGAEHGRRGNPEATPPPNRPPGPIPQPAFCEIWIKPTCRNALCCLRWCMAASRTGVPSSPSVSFRRDRRPAIAVPELGRYRVQLVRTLRTDVELQAECFAQISLACCDPLTASCGRFESKNARRLFCGSADLPLRAAARADTSRLFDASRALHVRNKCLAHVRPRHRETIYARFRGPMGSTRSRGAPGPRSKRARSGRLLSCLTGA